ncbi:MAG TPA: N-acetyltransferase [Anaerolineae bacterium]|jgi:putative acetyltransferase|nr:N-acetyltransferase [Anaerolineae bacterium]
MTVSVRPERPEDQLDIHDVNREAFGQDEEAELVDAVRQAGGALFSLVAVYDGQVVGHILFSPVNIESHEAMYPAVSLGPLAVLPEFQGQGIGSLLVKAGLAACREAGHGIVIVLGHPDYYPRFGFRPASLFGIRWEHDAPDEAFMVVELHQGAVAAASGVARYHPAFEGV